MANPRIIAGKAKGMRLKTLPGKITRPITDRVKEALFNIFGGDILSATFLDMFGGSGSVGIEALSRGAKYVEFIELNAKAYAILKENLSKSGLSENARIIKGDAFKVVGQQTRHPFDYIFIAPPQYHGMWIEALQLIDKTLNLLEVDGWVIVQIDPIEEENVSLSNLKEIDRRKYGSTILKFYSLETI